jgi:hypothetical protein
MVKRLLLMSVLVNVSLTAVVPVVLVRVRDHVRLLVEHALVVHHARVLWLVRSAALLMFAKVRKSLITVRALVQDRVRVRALARVHARVHAVVPVELVLPWHLLGIRMHKE